MEGLTGPLADALRRGRPAFNAKFAAATRADNPIDAPEFQRYLVVTVDPIIRSVAAEFAEKTDAVVEALFDLSLDLFRQNLLGPKAKYPAIPDAWRDIFPRIPRLLAKEPARVAGSVTNALYHLARTPGANCGTAFRLSCQTVEEFLDCGAIQVWTCGLPQYRESALAKAKSLPAAQAAKALDLPEGEARNIPQIIDILLANPWRIPKECLTEAEPKLKLVAQAGAFRGFNGQFIAPPKVECLDGYLIATDGRTTWRLHADIFNTVLQRCEPPAPHPPPLPPADNTLKAEGSDARIDTDGTVHWQNHRRRFPELAGATSIAALPHTLAITIPTSHHLFLVALS